jgi:hypothetical protein
MAEINIAGKKWSYYWNIVKIPILILVVGLYAGSAIDHYYQGYYMHAVFGIAGWTLLFAVPLFVGWTTVKTHKGGVGDGAWAGALTGIIAGFVTMTISIVVVIVQEVVALKQGVPGINGTGVLDSVVNFGLILGIVWGPFFLGVLGAFLSAVGAGVAKRRIAQIGRQ